MYELLKLKKKKPPKEVFGWKLFTAKKYQFAIFCQKKRSSFLYKFQNLLLSSPGSDQQFLKFGRAIFDFLSLRSFTGFPVR